MFDKLEEVELRFKEVEGRLADPDLAANPPELKRLSKEHSDLQDLVEEYRRYKKLKEDIASNKALLSDHDLGELAQEELKALEPEFESCKANLQLLLLPKDPNDRKNIILEIRAGAGGDEAGLFAAELFRMYSKYSERQRWSVELMSLNATGIGGYKEVIALITGEEVFSKLKFEAGVHRVQRVPDTETQGRVHTSTVTVAVMPEAEDVDIDINPSDLKIDVFRSGGAGGQSVNTTDSAVRITHLPSGVVVVCQDERSQHKNRAKAMKVLKTRLLDAKQEAADKEHADTRRAMVGTGDRSERIRTYNFPQGRLTDHRIGLTLYQLPSVMEGHLEEVIQSLQAHHQAEVLKAQNQKS